MEARPMLRPSLLIVDDDLRMRELVRDILADENFEPELCSDGLAAARLLTSRRFDIVITDLMMPYFDGLEILEVARNENPFCKVILITGHGSVDSAIKAIREGAHDYIQKPFEPEELLSCVRRAAREIYFLPGQVSC